MSTFPHMEKLRPDSKISVTSLITTDHNLYSSQEMQMYSV
jgi:hypothetical protein